MIISAKLAYTVRAVNPLITLRRIVPTLALMLACVFASAGHYRVTMSGGTSTESGSTQNDESYGADTDSGDRRGGDEWVFNRPFPTGDLNSSCQGALTATFDWQPDASENPPHTIIVREAIGAYAGVPAGASGTPRATTGEANETATSGGNQFYSPIADASIQRYTVKHDLAHFTLTCNPSAGVSIPATGQGGFGALSSVSYAVSVIYPKLVVTGGQGGGWAATS